MSGPSTKPAPAPLFPLATPFEGLEPAPMWRYFNDLTHIPRATGNEAGVREYVRAYASARGFACEVNEIGDVLLRVRPDARGPCVALQAHMDMVCVSRDGAPFDFARQPIPVRRDGDSICAEGTSLGADNGIGVAYALALAEETSGPIEVLLTVDEEQGFTGVQGVAPGWLRAERLINIDSEEEGYLTIASAGGRDFVAHLPAVRAAVPDAADAADAGARTALEVVVEGLKGGHSGVEIHRGRTNALKVAAQVVAEVRRSGGAIYGLAGGTAPNVIPSSARVVVGLAADAVEPFRARLVALQGELVTDEDPGLRLTAVPASPVVEPLAPAVVDRLARLLEGVPTGVIVASRLDPSQPFVSNNLAIVREVREAREAREAPALASGAYEIVWMSRSPADDELEKLHGRYRALAREVGVELEAGKLVTGWAPDYDSKLLARFRETYRARYGKDAKVLEIHAGLECGALKAKYPGLDAISVGPDITGVHGPDERVSIASTERTYALVRAVIDAIHAEG
jgi:dipeptidase D